MLKKGYSILARNYHSAYGEIDIIAQVGDTLAFIEVKTRDEHSRYDGKSAVTASKQQKIIQTAYTYLQEHTNTLQPRFDVAELVVTEDKRVFVKYLPSAFIPKVEW